MRISRLASLATLSALALAGCTVKDVNAPALSGPSTFGTNISIKASPEVLTQDGISQSTISISATDDKGNAKNVALRAEISFNGTVQDFGASEQQGPGGQRHADHLHGATAFNRGERHGANRDDHGDAARRW